VGKSSVINSLCRSRAVKVGSAPGITKTAQEVHLDKQVKLLDTPGIVFPKATDASDDIILRNTVKLERIKDPISPVAAMLRRCPKEVILSLYRTPDFKDVDEFLCHVARKNGKLFKGSVPNKMAAARIVLQDWTGGKIPFYTEPPAVAPGIHVGAKIVDEFSEDFIVHQTNTMKRISQFNKEAELFATSMGERSNTVASTNPYDTLTEDPEEDGDEVDGDDEDEDEDGNGEESGDEEAGSDEERAPASNDMVDVNGDADEEEDEEEVVPALALQNNIKIGNVNKKEKAQKKQNLFDEADQYNPQINKTMKKEQKLARKLKQKERKRSEKQNNNDGEEDRVVDYSFATDFVGDNNLNNGDTGDINENDIDVDDIDMD